MKCWGDNAYGQLGDDQACGDSCYGNPCCLTPVDVSGLSTGVSAISAGLDHTCAVASGGGVKCWGRNQYGQLGDGTTNNSSIPVNVSWLNTGVIAASAGGRHTCALTSGGGVKCWGSNTDGQLGDGSTDNSLTPVDVSWLNTGVIAASVGRYHTCALTFEGAAEHCTTDGSAPDCSSPGAPATIDSNMTLKCIECDVCGNLGEETIRNFMIDTAAAVEITSPVDGATVYIGYTGDILVTGTASTDITTVTVASDQGHIESSPVDIAGNWSVILTGCTVPAIVITAQATDDCGNTGSDSLAAPVIFAVCSISSAGPTTGCPGDAVTITGATFGITPGGVSFDSVTATIISWNDTSIIVEAPGGNYSNVTVAPTIAYFCSRSGIYYYDNDPPTGLAAAPAGGIYCTTPVTVSLSASDGAIYYTLDGTEPTTGNPVYTGPIDINEDTTLKFMAMDACGNQSYTVAEVYDIDDEAMVSITGPADGLTLIAGDVWVSGTADDDIARVTVTSDQGHSKSSGIDSAGNWSVVLSGVTLPFIDISATGTDNCGNIGSDLVTVPICEPTVWYVDDNATGNNDGTSWEDAFTVIQDAVDLASIGDWIWVAEGTYTTGPSTTVVLTMAAGVEIYGGFTGTESDLSERGDPAAHPTILDGEDTSYHVVLGASNARLDGFVVTDGNANGPYLPDAVAGGMANDGKTNLVVANCTFTGNFARSRGGGMYNSKSSLEITNCIFSGNYGSYGGGIYNYNNSSLKVTNCIFSENSAIVGGGIYNFWYVSLEITNCTFTGNSASMYCGGMCNLYTSITITNSILWDNDLSEIYNSDSTVTVSHSDVDQGGYAGNNGNIREAPLFVNVPYFGDVTIADGTTTTIEVVSAILYAVDDVIEIEDDGVARTVPSAAGMTVAFSPALPSPSTDYMLVENWGPGATDLDEDFHLQSDSPCIDTGIETGAPSDDLDGNPRPSCSGYDMGAYEYQCP